MIIPMTLFFESFIYIPMLGKRSWINRKKLPKHEANQTKQPDGNAHFQEYLANIGITIWTCPRMNRMVINFRRMLAAVSKARRQRMDSAWWGLPRRTTPPYHSWLPGHWRWTRQRRTHNAQVISARSGDMDCTVYTVRIAEYAHSGRRRSMS